jgi:hypothetical protein
MTRTLPITSAIRYGKTMSIERWNEARRAALINDLAAKGDDGCTIERIAKAYHEQEARV